MNRIAPGTAVSQSFVPDESILTCIEHESTLVWRLPLHISQSSIGGKTNLSNACTLIALKIAELIYVHNIVMPTPLHFPQRRRHRVTGGAEVLQKVKLDYPEEIVFDEDEFNSIIKFDMMKCPPLIVSCLANGIVDGNEAYAKDAGNESTRVYNLPDAIRACDLNFAEVDFKLSTGSIKTNLPKLIRLAVRCPLFQYESRLVFIMIGCIRTVLIVFDRTNDSLTLFDTHMHMLNDEEQNKTVKHGALIGSCPYRYLNNFVDWVQDCVFPDIKNTEGEFEISLIQITKNGDEKARNECQSDRVFRDPIRTPIFQSNNSQENKENQKGLDYPVLRSILSRPPQKTQKKGTKRLFFDFENGEKSGSFGKKRKESLIKPKKIILNDELYI